MEDDQQFCLRWNNHQSTLIQNFDTLLESGTLVDCTLAAEGKYLKAHKVVLSACSPYFEGLLSEHYDKHPVFILKDVKFKELKAMMDYMYRGEVNISQDQLAALLKAAESLQIKGLSESKTSGSSKTDSRQQKVVPQTSQPDIPISSSGLTIEKNKVPRQGVSQGPLGDLPEDSASPQIPKGLSSREGSQSPTSRKRKRFRRKSIGDDNSVENHEASNSSDMPQQMGVPALGIAPVADEKSHADPTDSIGRSALMTQLTKPADEMLQLPLEKPEPSDNLIEPKSEYLEDPEESVEDLTLDDDMNDLNEMEQDNNRAGPSHDPSQHPAGIGAWHVTGDRSNAGGVVGSVAGAPGTTDEVFLAAQEAAQAHRDSQAFLQMLPLPWIEDKYPERSSRKSKTRFPCPRCRKSYTTKSAVTAHFKYDCGKPPRFECPYCGDRLDDLLRVAHSRKYARKRDKLYNAFTGKFHCPNCNNGYGRRDTMLGHFRYSRMATEREVRSSGLRQRTRSREILITENGANADLSTREKNSSYRLRGHGESSASSGFQKINHAVPGIALFVPTEANLDFKQFFFHLDAFVDYWTRALSRASGKRSNIFSLRSHEEDCNRNALLLAYGASANASNDGLYVFLSINENT
ncbi:zinc finger and BTB domain-containing protein 9 isoform X2 [Bombus impatiens]|uniref:Zinc finger and BTB domain-containing protein 9 isoform X2 n=1 Tax=Bombus impatiens TaxID=132113 RepID=A0A6P6FKC9_BOMIM|nr:zinc finger and BTB domain-containing protein 9 isoform X2 [Bombus impatiens]